MISRRWTEMLGVVGVNALTWTIVIVVAFPLIWMVLTSIKPQFELFRIPPTFLPQTITFEHFTRLLTTTNFPRYFANSLLLSTATTLVVIAIATFGAYSLARCAYPGREVISLLVLLTYLLPSVVLIIPLYLFVVSIGLANTTTSLVIAYTSFALPYALWLLRAFMASLPPDIESAALVDGAGRVGAFVEIVLPQVIPGVVSTAVFTFILAWNEYLYALVLINADGKKPLPSGVLTMLVSSMNIEWSLLMAASVMMSIPLLIIFTFLQGSIMRGFGGEGVKG